MYFMQKISHPSFLVEHDIAFGAADLARKLFRDMFPDCEIAKTYYGCGRAKIGCLVTTLANQVYYLTHPTRWTC